MSRGAERGPTGSRAASAPPLKRAALIVAIVLALTGLQVLAQTAGDFQLQQIEFSNPNNPPGESALAEYSDGSIQVVFENRTAGTSTLGAVTCSAGLTCNDEVSVVGPGSFTGRWNDVETLPGSSTEAVACVADPSNPTNRYSLMTTDDSGATWSTQNFFVEPNPRACNVEVFSDSTWWVFTAEDEDILVRETTNGGSTFSSQVVVAGDPELDVTQATRLDAAHAADDLTVIVYQDNTGDVNACRSEADVLTWACGLVRADSDAPRIAHVSGSGDTSVFTVGVVDAATERGFNIVSDDGGTSWGTAVQVGNDFDVRNSTAVAVGDANVWFQVHSENSDLASSTALAIYRTSDSGASWSLIDVDPAGLHTMDFEPTVVRPSDALVTQTNELVIVGPLNETGEFGRFHLANATVTGLTDPLVVDAGGPYTATRDEAERLDGTVTGGASPITCTWNVVSGPGGATFSPNGTASACDLTDGTFNSVGDYVVSLEATDDNGTVESDTAAVTVTAPGADEFALTNFGCLFGEGIAPTQDEDSQCEIGGAFVGVVFTLGLAVGAFILTGQTLALALGATVGFTGAVLFGWIPLWVAFLIAVALVFILFMRFGLGGPS